MTEKTPSPGRKRWRAIATEIAIVVAGILIAFALDSWWDRRNDARREIPHLLALHADFQENLERLRRHIARGERTMEDSRSLLRLMRAGPLPPADSVANLFGQIFNSAQFDPATGAYDAIVGAGDFALIRDDTLRHALTGFAASIRTRDHERFAEQVYLALIGELAGRLRWLDWPGDAAQLDAAARRPLDVAALIRDPRFEDHLAMRMLSTRDVARQYGGLAFQAEQILATIEARLTEAGISVPPASRRSD